MRKKLDEYVAMTMEQRIEFLEKDRSKIRRENKKLSEKIGQLEEENQTLKDKIEFLTQCLDDRDKSIEIMKSDLAFIKQDE